MKFTLLFGICLMAALAYGQLIIDEDDPNGKQINDRQFMTMIYLSILKERKSSTI